MQCSIIIYYFAPYSLEYAEQILTLKRVRFFTQRLPIELAPETMLARVSGSEFVFQ